jgi:hypothetical protein
MKTVNIAGISCRKDKLDTLTYEVLFKQAKESATWLRVKNADALIDKELRKHGFKPAKKNTAKSKTSKSK